MVGPTIYLYSKRNSMFTILVMLVLGVLFTSNIYKAYYSSDRFDLMLFALLLALLACVLVIVITKRLMPAFKKSVILEFNEKGLTDHLRNIIVNWHDIQSIGFRRTRSSALLMIGLKWESDHGKDISISLRWVAGKDEEIYQTALAYLHQFSGEAISGE
jgi:hypothetical protein